MITKIDPSKPLGMVKLNVISKRTGKTFNTNFTMGSGSTTNETLRARLDPKLVSVMQQVFQNVGEGRIRRDGYTNMAENQGSVRFIDQQDDVTGVGDSGGSGRRAGLNLGIVGMGVNPIEGVAHQHMDDDIGDYENQDDDAGGYGSNDNHAGSDMDQ